MFTDKYGDLDDLDAKMYKNTKDPCCGARYYPWKRGESQVVEVDLFTDKETNQ